jgi:hypothetical protein
MTSVSKADLGKSLSAYLAAAGLKPGAGVTADGKGLNADEVTAIKAKVEAPDSTASPDLKALFASDKSADLLEVLNLLKAQGDVPNPPPTTGDAPPTTGDAPPITGGTPPPGDVSSEAPPTDENSPASQGGWKSWGTLVLGAVGVLAWIGSLFSSEEDTKGKAVFAGIGGLLLGGALLSQWPGIGKLFGRAIEAVKGVIQPENGAATEGG